MTATFRAMLVALFIVSINAAFYCSNNNNKMQSTTMLQLQPSQASQLVAAYNAAYCEKQQDNDDNDNDDYYNTKDQRNDNVQIKVVENNKQQQQENAPTRQPLSFARFFPKKSENVNSKDEDDICLYPIVGATLVRDGPDRCRVLPSVASTAFCCRLLPHDLPVYGWYSPACKVDNVIIKEFSSKMP